MKVSVFYSWQSDLPNSKNRGFIHDAIEKALKRTYSENKSMTDYIIDGDSRNEVGTPDLVESIFNKIDSCDIFIADISIINGTCDDVKKHRKTPNPNVLLELGYAAKSIGWSRIICVFNAEFAEIEDLPFDIRTRKPVVYDTGGEKSDQKGRLISVLQSHIGDIIRKVFEDKRIYQSQKRTIDLAMQAVLIDLSTLLYKDKQGAEKYNYPLLLKSSREDVESLVRERQFLGFELFKNIVLTIDDFRQFFQDGIETYFLDDPQKRLIVRLIFELRAYLGFLDSLKPDLNATVNPKLVVISGKKMNPKNPENGYLLVERLDGGKTLVISGGDFRESDVPNLLKLYTLDSKSFKAFSILVSNISSIIREWIEVSGGYFIANDRHIINAE